MIDLPNWEFPNRILHAANAAEDKMKKNVASKTRQQASFLTLWLFAAGVFECLPSPNIRAQNPPPRTVTKVAKVDPAMFEKFRRSILNNARKGPKVSNPYAFKIGKLASVYAKLAAQEKEGDIRRPYILATAKSNTSTAITPAGLSSSKHTTLDNAGATDTPRKSALPPIARTQMACRTPGIGSVNGTAGSEALGNELLFTPITPYNEFTIEGCGFGLKQGKVKLYGLPQEIVLNVEPGSWSDTGIVASVDPNLSGIPDQSSGVTLAVVPVGAAELKKGGFGFFAAREEVLLSSFPFRRSTLAGIVDASGAHTVGTKYFSPAGSNNQGFLVYSVADTGDSCPGGSSGIVPDLLGALSGGLSILFTGPAYGQTFTSAPDFNGWTLLVTRGECGRFGGGTDVFSLSNLPGQDHLLGDLQPSRFQWNAYNVTADTCNHFPGQDTLYTDGNWSGTWGGADGNSILITTQAATCHASGSGMFGLSGGTIGVSMYTLDIWVLHPRGVPLPAVF